MHPDQVANLLLQLLVRPHQHDGGVLAFLDGGPERGKPRRQARARGLGFEKRNQLLGQRRCIAKGIALRRWLDEEIEGVDHRHVGDQVDQHFQLVGPFGEDQPRDPVAVRILLPVQEVPGGLDVERVAEDRRAAVRRGPQPDLVRAHIDEPVELVGGSMLERDADSHACAWGYQSGFGSCANTRRSPSPHWLWIIWKYGSDSSIRRCSLIASASV